ncbi:hypothetical protein HB848_00250 [Listeria rocourtiae]|uniref:T7SS effector LXG polymorphic toxin n=1 Tax=Listeria rocourtiae TaxID=647910 RepID=UPI00162965BC|nr:T7SS effector LXG polymorphic toxin [Listeria rocourtiae]MBC1433769.1 hypothetical protein [Listeria rocourtiae]
MPRIEIGEVRYFVEQFLRESKRLRDALRDYRKAVAQLLADGEIQGEFIDSAKSYYETVHYPIIDTTIECLSEADWILKKYVQDFESQVDDAFDSRLDSDKLDALYAEIRRSENLLDDFTHAMDSMTGDLNIGQQIGMKLGLETSMMQIKEEIKILERYLDFEHSHTNVMHDVLSRMYQVKTGVNEILAGKAFNGTTHTYDSSKMQLGWLNRLVPEKKSKKTYNFDDYTKTLEGSYWVLSKNGITNRETAEASIAYNDGLKDGTIKREAGDEDLDFDTANMLAAMEGYNYLTGEEITKAQSFSIISAVLLGGIAMKGRGVKIPKSSLNKIESNLVFKGKNYKGETSRVVLKDTPDVKLKTSTSYKSGDKFPKELLKNKPSNSPVPDKWLNKGGKLDIVGDTWKYTDWEGNTISYRNGFPDFKENGFVKQEVQLKEFTTRPKDFREADKIALNGAKSPDSTWHHKEDGTTLQEVETRIHSRFTHKGGFSLKNK